ARLRRGRRADRHDARHSLRRRRAAPRRAALGRRGRRGVRGARDLVAVPARAADVVPETVRRRVRFGLPARAVADRDRPRRLVRRRARRERAEALLSPGGAYGLRVRRARGGARPRRVHARDPAVRRARLSRDLDRPAIDRGEVAVPRSRRDRHRYDARRSGVHQHRREHGPPADEGADAAASVVRPLEHGRHARRIGPSVPDPSRARRRGEAARGQGGGGMSGPVMIMAGGTGGHVFPGLTVADVLRERGRRVVWLGTRRGLEARVVPQHGIDIEWISVSGLRGKGLAGTLTAPFRAAYAVGQALAVLRRRKPSAVLGMGGFVSGPGGLAAWLTRRPLVIHEQNAIAGTTNRWLARFATRVFEAFPGSFPRRVPALHVGNPVRRAIAALPPASERIAEL